MGMGKRKERVMSAQIIAPSIRITHDKKGMHVAIIGWQGACITGQRGVAWQAATAGYGAGYVSDVHA